MGDAASLRELEVPNQLHYLLRTTTQRDQTSEKTLAAARRSHGATRDRGAVGNAQNHSERSPGVGARIGRRHRFVHTLTRKLFFRTCTDMHPARPVSQVSRTF